jgi:hypothetical protein
MMNRVGVCAVLALLTAGTSSLSPAGANQATVVRSATSASPVDSWGAVQIPLDVHGLTFDSTRGMVLASIGSAEGAPLGNTLTEFDPATGETGRSVVVGSEPGPIAVSGDGKFAWVGFRTTNAVVKVDLEEFKVVGFFALLGFRWDVVARELEVQPGTNDVVAVSVHNVCCSPSYEGVAVFDDGVQRGTTTDGHTGASTIAFSQDDPTKLYGYNNLHTGFGFYVVDITDEGPVIGDEQAGIFSGFFDAIEFDGGRLYGTNGQVVDPTVPRRLGTFAGSGAVEADSVIDRVYYLGEGTLRQFDDSSFLETGELNHPALADGQMNWGELVGTGNGLAAFGFDWWDDTRYLVLIGPDVEEREPPQLGLFSASATTNFGSGVGVRWRARDESGIAGFDVMKRNAVDGYRFGRWTTVFSNTTKTSMRVNPGYGTTICVRFRARDTFGNVSGWSAAECVSTPERARNVVSAGRWIAVREPTALAGEILAPDSSNARLSQRVRTQSVTLIVTKCAQCGKVRVIFNGRLIRTINTRSSTLQHRVRVPIVTWTTIRTGTIIVRPDRAGSLLGIEGILAPTPLE